MDWSARTGEAGMLAALGAGLGAAAAALDTVGRVLVGPAALLLLVLAARDVLLRPRLSAGPAGVVVRTLSGRIRLPWPQLQVRVRRTRRFGIRSELLELETAADDDVLVLLGRHDLGAAPEEVARALRALDPGGS